MSYNLSFPLNASTLIAQNITCAYPISDIYAPAPRYLYYAVLFLTFITLRYKWLSHIFLGAAVTYAACAAINIFIIIAHPARLQAPQNVTIPYVPQYSDYAENITAVVKDTRTLQVLPDAVELDIDAITAVVVSACLVGLPLQIWSRTMRSSTIIRYMILLWNIIMLAATICALLAWPKTNLAAQQYRFCFADYLDPDAQNSDGWDSAYWSGGWNATIYNIFEHPQTTWQDLTKNCFYPCFNTSQVIRQRTTLKAMVTTTHTKFAKLHNPARQDDDVFGTIIYLAVAIFAGAQLFLYLVSVLRLGNEALRSAVHEPHKLLQKRRMIWYRMVADSRHVWQTTSRLWQRPFNGRHGHQEELVETLGPRPRALVSCLRLLIDIFALFFLAAAFIFAPAIVVAFICWIEWYIRNDGSANETISQVGQWAPLVSVGVVLLASALYHGLNEKLASEEELKMEVLSTEAHLERIKEKLEKKVNIELESRSNQK